MSGTALPTLRHRTGLPDFDAARWTSLPPVEHVVVELGDWGLLLQRPAPENPTPREVVAPELTGAVLILVLQASRVEGRIYGTGAARPLRLAMRRGSTILLPPGVAAVWQSATGQERLLQLHVSPAFLARVAAAAGLPGREHLLCCGRLPRDATLDFLLRQLVRELRQRPPGWRRAIASAVMLSVAQVLGAHHLECRGPVGG